MATRGRKPTPTAIKELEGNPGKRKLNDREPRPEKKAPSCLKWLEPEAKKEWRRLAKKMELMGVLTEVNMAAFAGYCQAYARWKEAEEFITQHGTIVKTPSGYWQQVPQVSIAQTYLKMMQKFAEQFGLTPAARSRIVADTGENGNSDEMDRLLSFLPAVGIESHRARKWTKQTSYTRLLPSRRWRSSIKSRRADALGRSEIMTCKTVKPVKKEPESMRKRLISIGLILVMTASSAFCGYAEEAAVEDTAAEEISPEQISVTWDDSRVFTKLTLGSYKTITTYGVEGYEDVPFLAVNDYLDILLEEKERISTEGGVMTIRMNGTEAVIDPVDTIYFENPAKFRSDQDVDRAVIDEEELNVITFSEKNPSVQEEGNPLMISMRDYHMPVIAYEDTILMPFLALQNSFGCIGMDNLLAYNGKDYYNVLEAKVYLLDLDDEAENSPYINAIYSGPFSEKTETTEAYAEYGYYSICLLLDLTKKKISRCLMNTLPV